MNERDRQINKGCFERLHVKSVAGKCGLPGKRSENPVASVAKPIQADSAVIP